MANYNVKQLNFTKDGNTYTITGETYESKQAASGGTAVSLVTTGEKYTWNNKAGTSIATTSVNGLMSSTDKAKLDSIASGATANVGTITGITMNGVSKGTSGVVDLGNVIAKTTGQASGKFLQTDSNGEAVWGTAASPSSVVSATEAWLTANVPTGTTVAIDRSLMTDGAAADAKVTGKIKTTLEKTDKELESISGLIVPTTVALGALNTTNGAEIDSSDGKCSRTEFIECFPSTRYTITLYNNANGIINDFYVIFYTSSQTFISAQQVSLDVAAGNSAVRNVTTPSNCKYFRLRINSYNKYLSATNHYITVVNNVNKITEIYNTINFSNYKRLMTASDTFANLTDSGVYDVANNIITQIADAPTQNIGGRLLVIKYREDIAPIQIFLTNDTIIYFRERSTSRWKRIGLLKNYYADAVADNRGYFVHTVVDKPITLSSGKHFYVFGDSIATTSHGGFTWGSIIESKTGSTGHYFGVGGYSFVNGSTTSQRIIDEINGVSSWSSCDVCFIAAGTNDATRLTTASDLKVAVQNVIDAIKTNAPNAKIVFITPIQRADMENNAKLPMISGTICNVALLNDCSVINGFDFPIAVETNDWITDMTDSNDGLHPGTYGKHVYARCVLNALGY